MVMLSDALTVELKREFERLVALEANAKRKIAAIRALLDDETEVIPHRNRIRLHENGSFASHVRDAMRTFDRAVKSKEVAEILANKGVSVSGKTPLVGMVSAELHRMSTRGTGDIERVDRGLYRIRQPQETESAPS